MKKKEPFQAVKFNFFYKLQLATSQRQEKGSREAASCRTNNSMLVGFDMAKLQKQSTTAKESNLIAGVKTPNF